ncbi:hypothetical protein D3C75_908350 [compost metagenome]
MFDRLGHWAGRRRTARCIAGFQVADQILLRPAADTGVFVRGDVIGGPGSEIATGEGFVAVHAHGEVPWGMAGAAVGQRFDQITALIPLGALGWVWL